MALKFALSGFCVLLCLAEIYARDKPCAGRLYPGQSYGCVCNATYCDEITRQPPTRGRYVAYTTSAAGLRLAKSQGKLKTYSTMSCANYNKVLVLNPEITYQTIEGFGGAVTDSSSMSWKNMSVDLQKHLINSYYGPKGIGYTMARVPIGGCDFSTHPYAYNESPVNDTKLSNYSLTVEDYQYKIPMIKAIKSALKEWDAQLEIVASVWSPPEWMKEETDYNVCGHLRKEYMQTYADYFKKFIELYNAEKIKIWAVTTTNEPITGFLPLRKGNCLGWYPKDMGEWIANNLGPTIRNMKQGIKILGGDDQRFTIPLWFYGTIKEKPEALQYIDGLAIHFYGDIITPASLLTDVSKSHPDKFLIYTESCAGAHPWVKEKVQLGSWSRSEDYMYNIMTDINHNVVGWVDWNLVLNEMGGPNWVDNYVDSPIIAHASKGEFIKNPMFYAMAHVAKFVVRGSKRIKIVEDNYLPNNVQQFGVLTPDDTIVVVLFNGGDSDITIGIRLGPKFIDLWMPARSYTTVETPYEFNQNCKLRSITSEIDGTPVEIDYENKAFTITYNPC